MVATVQEAALMPTENRLLDLHEKGSASLGELGVDENARWRGVAP